ncbi:retron St85 family RNA-directed DNA polymerase (plasmid) [Tistrella mobilis]|uniref:retron St85 family RNA-directed DNA polymerase n=1 Tax=Tistrella mobilis TaxID=171437 RepID=UPI0009EF4D7F|nr:retron St85 family RNA-directed DNA polymerase [Tistrella mobilis]
MPTRSYYFPKNFTHLEAILRAEPDGFPDEQAIRFRDLGLPPIPTAGTLPIFLGISPKIIFSIRRRPRRHYRSFSLIKKDGTERTIDTPRTYLKVIQWWILDNITSQVEISRNAFGFVRGRSAVQNAGHHLGAQHILNVDIRQFFPSVKIAQVFEIFMSIGYNEEVAEMLSELCCIDGHLPQGAPTSPSIANLILRDLDENLCNLADRSGCLYSRYADDLTFSSHSRINDNFLESVRKEVENSGFKLKSEKTRFSGRGDRMEVTGVVINEKLQPPRDWRKLTRAKLHKLDSSNRLTRRQLSYLQGVMGMAPQFPDSPQIQQLSEKARLIAEQKLHTIIGHGPRPILQNGLSLRESEALAALVPSKTNLEVAIQIGINEVVLEKRLERAYKKIGAENRQQAISWADQNL